MRHLHMIERTDAFVAWVEAQKTPLTAFDLPSPLVAGVLAAVRLKRTHYRSRPLDAKNKLVRQVGVDGWLEVRQEPGKPDFLKLTERGRVALDALLEVAELMRAQRGD